MFKSFKNSLIFLILLMTSFALQFFIACRMNNLHNPAGLIQSVSPQTTITPALPIDPAIIPTNGGWSPWEESVSCSKTCGGGLRTEIRTCTNPIPANGGIACEGPSERTLACNEQSCDDPSRPIDGGWSDWDFVGTCTAACGPGQQQQTRLCNNPIPANGGKICEGPISQFISCTGNLCPIDGGWGTWFNIGTCSVLCGGGTVTQKRYCNSPNPAYGGQYCEGLDQQIQNCNTHICPTIAVQKAKCSWVQKKLFIDATFTPADGVINLQAFQGEWWNDLPIAPSDGKTLPGANVYIINCPATIKLKTNRGGELDVLVERID